MRFQTPIKNRKKLYAGTLSQVKHRIEQLAVKYDCSKSFVINTILADSLNIHIEERYDDYRKNVRKIS